MKNGEECWIRRHQFLKELPQPDCLVWQFRMNKNHVPGCTLDRFAFLMVVLGLLMLTLLVVYFSCTERTVESESCRKLGTAERKKQCRMDLPVSLENRGLFISLDPAVFYRLTPIHCVTPRVKSLCAIWVL